MLYLLRVEMVINSPWMMSKNWLVQKQTAFGKDISNQFMADNLPKIGWFSTHRVTFMKSWLVQKQMALDPAEGFEQIIDFLSGSYIHYALTVNPHIYVSCIKQFWNTASVKHSDDVTRLQALVDRKKIVISEVVIREILQLDDAEDTCSALTRRVENLEHDKAAQKLEIIKLMARVKRLERANKVKSSKLKRLTKIGASKRIESSDDMEDVFNQGRMIDDLDKDEGIELVVDQVKDADIAETEGSEYARG
nr:hypothetical protein [Tanacetum cinerariifolium]